MNGPGLALAGLSITVTVVATTALVLERVASRRGPRAGSWVAAASLVVTIVLTPLAFCPIPPLLTWRPPSSSRQAVPALFDGPAALTERGARGEPIAGSSATETEVGAVEFSWRSLSRRLGAGLAWGTDSIRQRRALLTSAWFVFVLAGASGCLVRLLLGLWGVRDCRRKGKAITDPDLLAVVDSLRLALGVNRPIEVRTMPDMSFPSAAAVGWRRPLVLLPGNWRSWTDTERRAVLAHEVAHIARADYAAGVVARLGLALHFYHPLVHWMVARLQLQQELAADAEAARFVGGRRAYLLTLSRLALTTHKAWPAWPAAAFLPRNGHLIRRIHMLKDQSQPRNGSISLAGRVITIAFLAVVGLVALGLRSPSPIAAAEVPPGAEKKPSQSSSEAEPFDLAYVPKNAMGLVAFRPAAIFQREELRPALSALNALFAKEFFMGTLKLDAIEQATFGVYVSPRDRKAGKPGRFMFGGGMLRTVHDFDWKSLVEPTVKRLGAPNSELVEKRFEGVVYYKVTHAPGFILHPCFYFPDARTMVNASEEEVRRLATRRAADRPEYARGADWKQFERGLIAVALDNHDQRWRLDQETAEPEDLPVAPLLQNATRWACGVDGADALMVRAIATCATDDQGQSLARTAESLLAMLREAARNTRIDDAKGKKDELEASGLRVARELLEACKLHRDGSVVELSSECHLGLDFLVKLIMADGGL